MNVLVILLVLKSKSFMLKLELLSIQDSFLAHSLKKFPKYHVYM